MRKLECLVMFFALLLTEAGAQQVTAYYRPTPYPLFTTTGTPMPQDPKVVHLWDGWLNDTSGGQKLIRDDKLLIGGSGNGDHYRTYLKFDLTGLPANVDKVSLGLYNYDSDSGPFVDSYLIGFDLWRVTSNWPSSLTWDNQPGFGYYHSWDSGSFNCYWGLNITTLYNDWQSGKQPNYGLALMSWSQDNCFDVWRSSRTSNHQQRPALYLCFTPTLQLKMPLPDSHYWLVTTEVGGYDCLGKYDEAHDGLNYFSIDFAWENIATGATKYDQTSKIPVLAAADGRVVFAGKYDRPDSRWKNGYFVVIDHDKDGDLTTGFSTRYLHLREQPLVSEGQDINQGDILGYMGETGFSDGVHLHFGVRYKNNGSSSVPELTKVLMDGRLLKSYQTECRWNSEGEPTSNWILCYLSQNRISNPPF